MCARKSFQSIYGIWTAMMYAHFAPALHQWLLHSQQLLSKMLQRRIHRIGHSRSPRSWRWPAKYMEKSFAHIHVPGLETTSDRTGSGRLEIFFLFLFFKCSGWDSAISPTLTCSKTQTRKGVWTPAFHAHFHLGRENDLPSPSPLLSGRHPTADGAVN